MNGAAKVWATNANNSIDAVKGLNMVAKINTIKKTGMIQVI